MVNFSPIGIIHTCYKEKFGIPRQPGLVDAPARLVLYPEFAREETVRGLDGFSHIWLLFLFHHPGNCADPEKSPGWSAMVRPPRLGGNKKVGVFSSRSPFRPNPVGLSAVRLRSVDITDTGAVLHLSGVDMLDQTPILDIKPYLPYSDSIPDARDGFAGGRPESALKIRFSEKAQKQIREKEGAIPGLKHIITGILKQDPRPAYTRSRPGTESSRPEQQFGIRIFDVDLKWSVKGQTLTVTGLEPETTEHKATRS